MSLDKKESLPTPSLPLIEWIIEGREVSAINEDTPAILRTRIIASTKKEATEKFQQRAKEIGITKVLLTSIEANLYTY